MTTVLGVLVGYTVLVALVPLLLESRFLYYPTRGHDVTPEEIGLTAERVSLRTDDGVVLDAVWCAAPEERAALLFLHGNAGNLSHRLDNVKALVGRGISVLLLDYRGYGRSGGEASEEGLHRDARAAWAWLRERRDRVFLFGRSI
ncbi:MAG: alpha/beta hydrolase, partial [Planctomycetota bacterium]